ncbi:MAG: WbqC family protein [Bacteroidetes bacterium]|nr:WbqC family protein [Bacteroidota bacterium]
MSIPCQIPTVYMSTALLPPVAYMAVIRKMSNVKLEALETYRKQSFRNRFEILTTNGRVALTIPVRKTFGNHTLTSEIKICYAQPWQKVIRGGLEAAYNSSPYFLYFKDELFSIFAERHDKLIDLNHTLLMKILDWTGIQASISYTHEFYHEVPGCLDLRYAIHPGKIIPEMVFPEYFQTFSDRYCFQANLSILDLLFNLGPEAGNYLDNVRLPWISGGTQS